MVFYDDSTRTIKYFYNQNRLDSIVFYHRERRDRGVLFNYNKKETLKSLNAMDDIVNLRFNTHFNEVYILHFNDTLMIIGGVKNPKYLINDKGDTTNFYRYNSSGNRLESRQIRNGELATLNQFFYNYENRPIGEYMMGYDERGVVDERMIYTIYDNGLPIKEMTHRNQNMEFGETKFFEYEFYEK